MTLENLKNALTLGVINENDYEFILLAMQSGYTPIIEETRRQFMRPELTITLIHKRII